MIYPKGECEFALKGHYTEKSYIEKERISIEKFKKSKNENKHRGGSSNATTSLSLIVPLLTISVDEFLP